MGKQYDSFPNVNVVACYVDDNKQFLEIEDFVQKNIQDCKIINLWEIKD